jgi:ribosomal protein L40E
VKAKSHQQYSKGRLLVLLRRTKMAEILEKFRERASKAAFEADKLRRITRIQRSIGALKRELGREERKIGNITLQLYDAGQLTQPELIELCEQLAPLRNQIAEKEAEIERIRQEKPPEVPVPAIYGHICPRCKIKLPEEAVFCPHCGTKAQDIAPPSIGPVCPSCGATLVEGAIFCPSCGIKIEEEVENIQDSP